MFENLEPAKNATTSFVLSDWLAYIGVLVISIWGGLVSFFERKEKFSWVSLFAHLSSSSFAGMMTFLGCQYTHISGPLVGILCGVAAHMGTPALLKLAAKFKIVRDILEKEGLDENGDKKQ